MRTVLKLQHLTCQAQDIIDDLDIEEEDRAAGNFVAWRLHSSSLLRVAQTMER